MTPRRQPTARILLLATAAPVALGSIAATAPNTAPTTANPPTELVLTGTVRDFRERTKPGGHPDFEATPTHGFGQYCDNIVPLLGADKKPVFKAGGFRVATQWRDAAGRPICWNLFDPSRGDQAGSKQGTYTDTGGIASAASFSTWFNDNLALNVSTPLSVTLRRQPNGSYVFDSQTDPVFMPLGGFFPIEHQLFGNPGGTPDRNFHFTFELHTKFTYSATGNQIFSFRGDDDVWAFIDRKLVIDLGGVHAAIEQVVDLNRLGLEDGKDYELCFFFAERHRTQSNFKMTTNLQLETIDLPLASNAFD
jgi:fibro-slime domain-containing protein